MGFDFNICEIFDIAELIERNGERFYRTIAERFKGSDTREVLLELAGWEKKYADSLASIRKGFSEEQCPSTVFDPENKDSLYLRAMADEHVFDIKKDVAGQLTGQESKADVLKMAVELEKDAVVFYLALKGFIKTKSQQDKVDYIIEEKMNHIAVLNRELENLGKTE